MKKLIYTFTFILIFAFTANAQTDSDNLKQCTQFLNKSMAETSACKEVNKAKDKVIKLLESNNKLLKEQIAHERKYADLVIKRQEGTIKRLEQVKCSKTKFFWGIISVKKCY